MTTLNLPGRRQGRFRKSEAAFTFTQLIVAIGIFLFIIAGVIVSQIGGMKLLDKIQKGLLTTDETQRALNRMIPDIREGRLVRVGAGSLTSFTDIDWGLSQIGNAIQINTSTNTNSFIRYYYDTTDKIVKRTTNGVAAAAVLSYSVTNQNVFRAEDFQGNILTNNASTFVLRISFEFDPKVRVPSQVEMRVTRRAAE